MTDPGRVFIIAEAGVNHNGSLDMARELVDVAAAAGADAVKFQTFRAEKIATAAAPKAGYQEAATGSGESQFAMLKRLELDGAAHRTLLAHCREKGIAFLSTPFDEESVELLAAELDLPLLKLPSGEITNGPLLLAAARTGKPLILSTGMSTLDEVRDALGVIAFGYVDPAGVPSRDAFERAFAAHEGQRLLGERVTLLHCTTEYPAPFGEVNLRAMATLRETFGLPTGYSDHTEGIAVPVAAAALGARVIEKHFTLDRSLPGPDHKASLEPGELAALVRSIRQVEAALGSPDKGPTPAELANLPVARKSLVAAAPIAGGELFTERNITVKRPGTGMSPMNYWEILGKTARRDYLPDEQVEP